MWRGFNGFEIQMIMKTIIKDLNNLRPTKEQVKDKPAYYAFGYVDAINSAIEVVKNNAVLHSVMPSLHIFKERREKLKLTLRQVAKETNVSAATISRIERAEGECSYHNVVQLDDFYCHNGV